MVAKLHTYLADLADGGLCGLTNEDMRRIWKTVLMGEEYMDFTGKHILLAEGRARQSLPFIRSFKKMGCEVSALCASKLDVSYASRYTDHKILGVCDNQKPEETYEQLKSLIETRKYDLVVPTTDFIASLLSKHKEEFSKFTHVASNDWGVYQLAGDKLLTMKVCMENDIPCPYTLAEVTLLEQVLNSTIQYPIVVKPRVGYGVYTELGEPRARKMRAMLPRIQSQCVGI